MSRSNDLIGNTNLVSNYSPLIIDRLGECYVSGWEVYALDVLDVQGVSEGWMIT